VWDFDSSVWIPYKIRYDKDKPNFIDVAKDVFEDINTNPDVMDIVTNNTSGYETSGSDPQDNKQSLEPREREHDSRLLDNNKMCLTNFNKYSNVEKRKLIEKYATGVVLDLGTGKLGDIHKYNKNRNVKKLWGVEPDEFNRTEALKRLSEKADLRIDVKILPFKAQETQKIVEAVKTEVDVVSSFFSLTFFFENKNVLNSFCETVSRNLKAGGHFIGTTMDGQRTFNLLKGKSSLSVQDCYHITKKYKDNEKSIGQMLDIRLENTIVDQTEWLAWFDIFTDTMNSHGLSLVESTYFGSYDELSIHESTLFHCYRSFVFRKDNSVSKSIKQIIGLSQSDTELTETEQRKQDNKDRLKVERKNKLKMLDTDETEPFDNLYGEKQQLTRIGTIGDGSCFFHSVLYLIDKKYRKYSEEDRGELVKIIRELFGDSISRKKWKSMGNGNLALTFFLIKLSEEYPDIVPDTSVKNVDELISKLKGKYHKNTDEFDQLLEEVYQEYIESVKDCDVWVGENLDSVNLFEYICEIFDINIYIIRDSTRKPYLMGSDCSLLYKNRPSIIILWINDSHYEAVSVDNKLLFQFNDPVIQRIHNIICGKENKPN
jgi:mRNA (guanine-N7-)-methyltransferase